MPRTTASSRRRRAGKQSREAAGGVGAGSWWLWGWWWWIYPTSNAVPMTTTTHGKTSETHTKDTQKQRHGMTWRALAYAALCFMAVLVVPSVKRLATVTGSTLSTLTAAGSTTTACLWRPKLPLGLRRQMELALPLALALPNLVLATNAFGDTHGSPQTPPLAVTSSPEQPVDDTMLIKDAQDGDVTDAMQQEEEYAHLNPFAAPVDPNAKRDPSYRKLHKVPPAPMRDNDLSTGPGGLILLIFPAIAYGIYYIRKPAPKQPQRTTRNVAPPSRIAERLAAVAEAHKSFRSTLISTAASIQPSVLQSAKKDFSSPPQIDPEISHQPTSSHETQTESSYLSTPAGVALRQNLRRRSRQLKHQASFVSAKSSLEDGVAHAASGQSPPLLAMREPLAEDSEEDEHAALPEAALRFRDSEQAYLAASNQSSATSGWMQAGPVGPVGNVANGSPSTQPTSTASNAKKHGLSALFRKMGFRSTSQPADEAAVTASVGTMPEEEFEPVDRKSSTRSKAKKKAKGASPQQPAVASAPVVTGVPAEVDKSSSDVSREDLAGSGHPSKSRFWTRPNATAPVGMVMNDSAGGLSVNSDLTTSSTISTQQDSLSSAPVAIKVPSQPSSTSSSSPAVSIAAPPPLTPTTTNTTTKRFWSFKIPISSNSSKGADQLHTVPSPSLTAEEAASYLGAGDRSVRSSGRGSSFEDVSPLHGGAHRPASTASASSENGSVSEGRVSIPRRNSGPNLSLLLGSQELAPEHDPSVSAAQPRSTRSSRAKSLSRVFLGSSSRLETAAAQAATPAGGSRTPTAQYDGQPLSPSLPASSSSPMLKFWPLSRSTSSSTASNQALSLPPVADEPLPPSLMGTSAVSDDTSASASLSKGLDTVS
ncbi:hypothetical protein HDU96_002914, partial [Phlyctochytrium bullatum]